MKLSWSDLCALLENAGSRLYGGEAISQLEHALQSAHFAQQAGGDTHAICAALLHDIGHIVAEQRDDDLANGMNDQHEALAIPLLKPLFGEAICAPIALHVAAKRYLCAIEADYYANLSPASQASLQLQGGVMTPEEVARFAANPYAEAAVFLRRCDDQAKIPQFVTPPSAYFLDLPATLCKPNQASI